MRKTKFANGEFYHIYNRGTDKRAVFLDDTDIERFLYCMDIFNAIKPIGSLYEHELDIRHGRPTSIRTKKLANIICYCLNFNHYHLLLEQLADGGISEFMKRLGGGFTKYFNIKYRRSGVLFQGKFKSSHVDSNEYLLHIGAYINLNNKVHKLQQKIFRSSWDEFLSTKKSSICAPQIILQQFKNHNEFKAFAESSLVDILERKQDQKEFARLLIE